jgi:gliding motility-associated-like protein
MSELNNIDKLLKESFSEFTPDAPNVWQGIEQGVQAAQAGHAAGVAGAVKGGMGIVAKIVAVVAVSASLVTGYVLLSDKKEEAPVAQITNQTTVAETQPQVATEESEATLPNSNEIAALVTTSSADHKTTKPETFQASKPKGQVEIQPSAPTTDQTVSKTEPIKESLKRDEPQATTATVVTPSNKTTTPETVKPTGNLASEATGKTIEQPGKKEWGKPVIPDKEQSEIFDEPVIPGSFSPNGDGINDRYVIMIERESSYSLVIQDLKGNTVFESDNESNTWDGKDSRTGMLCAQGSFYYIFNYQFKGSQQPHKKTGLIRLF